MKAILLLLFTCFALSQTQAQITGDNYPVQAHVFVSGAGSLKLSDYFTSSTKLGVDLILKDLTKSSLDVYLSWEIEGLGLGIQAGSSPGFVPGSFISLNRGSVRKLKGIDLRAYFQPGVVVAAGVSEASVFSGSLPEGFYVLRVRAYEAGTGREVSNRAETYFSVAYALPPVLNQPLTGSEVTVTRPQNVLLQWTPRHTSTGSNLVTYQMKVCEVAEDDEPNVAILGSQTCFTVPQQTTTTYMLKASDLPLKPGKRYAWQVQATDLNGALEFQNTGNSEVAWFRYGKACTAPEELKATEIGPNRVNLSWKADPQAMGYKLYYKNQTATEWQTQITFGTSLTLVSLDQKEPYNFKISTLCDIDNESPTSPEETWEAEEIDTELQKLIDAVLHPLDQISSSTTPTASPKTDNVSTSALPTSQAATKPLPTSIADLIPTDPTKIPCVSQVRGFENCSVTHDGVTLMGTEPLQSLDVGDPLTIYDMLAIVTEVSGGGGTYSGKALIKLPFLADMMMAVEFSNIEVKTEKPTTYRGGCVTNVPSNGFFRARTGLSREELKAEEVALIDQIRKAQDPGSTYTTFGQQISQYDQTSMEIADATAAGQSLSTEQKEALLAQTLALNGQISTWLENATDLIGGTTAGDAILAQIQAILDQLAANQTAMEAGTSFPSVPNIGSTITSITDQIKALLNAPPTDTPRIQNLQATKITDKSATLSWEGDKRFTKYIVTVQKPGEGERIFDVSGEKLDLDFLSETSEYNIKVVGYVENEKIDTEYGSFDTKTIKVQKPENVKLEILDNGKLSVTWDKNDLHKSFVFKYKDKNGIEKIAYPTKNKIEIADFDFNMDYEYSVVAVGESAKRSEGNDGNFNFDKNCNRFNRILASSIFGSSTLVSAGTEVELSISLIQNLFCLSKIEWTYNEEIIGEGQKIIVHPYAKNNTYSASCSEVFNGNGKPKTACSTEITIEAIPSCEVTRIELSKNEIYEGEEILLKRGRNCLEAQRAYWGDANGNEISSSINLLVKPKKDVENTWYLYCVNNGNTCRTSSPTITFKNECDQKFLWFPRVTRDKLLVNYAGCDQVLSWDISAGDVNKKKFKTYSEEGYTTELLSRYSNSNALIIDHKKRESDPFTITAKCDDSCPAVTKVFNKAESCERNYCGTFVQQRSIENTNLEEVILVGSSANTNPYVFYYNMYSNNRFFDAWSNLYTLGTIQIFSSWFLNTHNIAGDWGTKLFNDVNLNQNCDGSEIVYNWRELGEKGAAKIIERKDQPYLIHIDPEIKSLMDPAKPVTYCLQPIEILIPAKDQTSVIGNNSEPFIQKTELNNDIEYVFPRGCQNEYEEGVWMLESQLGIEFKKQSEIVPMEVAPKPWHLKAYCILSGNVYFSKYEGKKSPLELASQGMEFQEALAKLVAAYYGIPDIAGAMSYIPIKDVKYDHPLGDVTVERLGFEESPLTNSSIPPTNANLRSSSKNINTIDNIAYSKTADVNVWIEYLKQIFRKKEGTACPTGSNLCGISPLEGTLDGAVLIFNVYNTILKIKEIFENDEGRVKVPISAIKNEELDLSVVQTYLPLGENLKFDPKTSVSSTTPVRYLVSSVATKVVNDLCQKVEKYNIGSGSRKEIACKLYNNFKAIGLIHKDDDKFNEIQDAFAGGDCEALKAFIGTLPGSMSSKDAEAIFAQNDAIMSSAGDGECSDEINNTLTVTAIPKQPTCKNNDGEIEVTATGGSGSYEYKLSTSTTWQIHFGFKNLAPGTYIINVKDSDGNRGTTTVTLRPNQTITLQGEVIASSCANSSNKVILSASGGALPLFYNMDNGQFLSSNTFNNVSSGKHTFSVKDANDCKQTIELNVPEVSNLDIKHQSEPEVCGADGSISITVSGGIEPYKYKIDGIQPVPNSNVFNNLEAKNYQITVEDATGACASIQVEVEDQKNNKQPEVIPDEIPTVASARTLANLRANNTTVRYFITPDGKGFILPEGATPLTFDFNTTYPPPPLGTLQGFSLNGNTYFAEIQFANQATPFKGYRKTWECVNGEKPAPEYYQGNFQTLSGVHPAIYQHKYKDNTNGCGHKGIPFEHNFRADGFLTQITETIDKTIAPTYDKKYTDQNDCPTDGLIEKNQLKTNGVTLTETERKHLQKMIDLLNPKLGFKVNLTIAVVPADKDGKALQEGQTKDLHQFEKYKMPSGDWVFLYSDIEPNACGKEYIEKHMSALEQSAIYKSQQPLDKVLIRSAYYIYNMAFAALHCEFREEEFYTCQQPDADGNRHCVIKSQYSCPEAFVAGIVHSVAEDLNVVDNAVGIVDMAWEVIKGTVNNLVNLPKQLWEYPDQLKAAMVELKASTTSTNGPVITTQLVHNLMPPPKQSLDSYKTIANFVDYIWTYYAADANCWTSGELTAMAAPLVLSAGAYGVYKAERVFGKMAGRFKKVFTKGKDVIDFFKAGKKLEHVDIPDGATGDIKQIAKRSETDAVDEIWEETPKGSGNYSKICGSCLALNTAVFGTNATLESLKPLTSVQTLEKDGSISQRNVWGKVGRKVSEYVKIFVGKDELQSTSEHEFKTAEGWKPASYLRKGALLFSLALNSFVSIDSVAMVHEPLEVEGLSLGDVQGYGVGSLGVVTATSPSCLLGFTQEHYNKVQGILDPAEEKKFIDYLNSNDNLESTKGLKDIAVSSADQAENVAKAWKKVDDLSINGLQLKKKGFAGNNDARRYQRQASGHEDFSFEYNGKSYDNIVTENGVTTMIDRKAGYGYSIFDPDGDIRSEAIRRSLIDKATEQVRNIEGSVLKLRWEVSTQVGATGIKTIFEGVEELVGKIDVIFVELLP